MERSRRGAESHVLSRFAIIAAAVVLSACSGSDHDSNACDSAVACGHFDIEKTKESSPVFLAGLAANPIYRICTSEGSVIVQTIEPDGSATSIGAEIRAGNCSDIAFADKVYIIGNTAPGRSAGIYYHVP
jgi:hypothetical protein